MTQRRIKKLINKLVKKNVNVVEVARMLSRHNKCTVVLQDDTKLIFNIVFIDEDIYGLVLSYNNERYIHSYIHLMEKTSTINSTVQNYLYSL